MKHFCHLLFTIFFSILTGCSTPDHTARREEEQLKFPIGYDEPVRGTWLTNIASDALFSFEGIKDAVAYSKELGLNTLFVVTWNDALTIYRSRTMEDFLGVALDPKLDPNNNGRDPLSELIEEAHKEGIKVIAWFEFGFSSSYKQQGGPILEKKPNWSCITSSGELCVKNGFDWMNALHPEVQEFISSLVLEVVDKYDIDGIQGDDRLPAMPSSGGYDSLTVAMYQQEHDGRLPPEDYKNEAWVDWRAKKLNTYLNQLYKDVKERKPDCIVSMAPSIYPWSKVEYLQDWPSWLEGGYVDMICPQVYRKDSVSYKRTLEATIDYVDSAHMYLFYPGILIKATGVLSPSKALVQYKIALNRQYGIPGEVFFYYEGLTLYDKEIKASYLSM
ncbi:MAG: family 10 glycosylhydrolase [Ekhidna sp.]|nr:family 10 glycosylhydrolase [Ekhidna sp.]